MAVDFRREWVKKKTLKMLGLKDDCYFNNMLASSQDLDEKLSSFLDDDFLRDEDREILCIYKFSDEKLIEEEIMVPQTGKSI